VDIPAEAAPAVSGDIAVDLTGKTLNRGALGAAAQALGLAQRMVDMSVQYTGERQQFGKLIGSFQAVKHHMANVAVALEYAKAPVHRAAYSIAMDEVRAGRAVSHAKLVACAAANLAARTSVQVHGAMGSGPAYFYEEGLGPGQHLGRRRVPQDPRGAIHFFRRRATGRRGNFQLTDLVTRGIKQWQTPIL
jgi:hypothetical protein